MQDQRCKSATRFGIDCRAARWGDNGCWRDPFAVVESQPRAIAQPHHAAYYRQHEPIGCRDVATVELLRQIGVEAYLSGCHTLTLQNGAAGRTDQIYMVDVPDALCPLIPAQIRRNAIKTTHLVGLPANLQHRLPPRRRGAGPLRRIRNDSPGGQATHQEVHRVRDNEGILGDRGGQIAGRHEAADHHGLYGGERMISDTIEAQKGQEGSR